MLEAEKEYPIRTWFGYQHTYFDVYVPRFLEKIKTIRTKKKGMFSYQMKQIDDDFSSQQLESSSDHGTSKPSPITPKPQHPQYMLPPVIFSAHAPTTQNNTHS